MPDKTPDKAPESVPGNTQPQEPVVPPCLMTIFGATGDLTKRLLLPSIYNLVSAKVLPDAFQLIGVAKDDWPEDKFKTHIEDSLKQFWGDDADPKVIDWLSSRATYQQADFGDAVAFDTLKSKIEEQTKKAGKGGNLLFYLAIAPSFIADVAAQISRVGLFQENDGCWSRLVIEKPFGNDLPSALDLNKDLQANLREDQIYRIDHFAGKDGVQDLAVFRFSNTIIEPLWNRSLIDNIQITASEIVGVEKRAGYYESAGALRDMVPNHMAELLSLVAMEPPVSFDAKHLRNKQVELLASTRRLNPEDVSKYAVRGQYGTGKINGADVPAYRSEPDVKPGSNTETFVAMKVEIDNWRWSGVPFYLRTGKRMTSALTEIIVTFRQPPARLFPNADKSNTANNQLIFNLQPTQQIQFLLGAKAPGLRTLVEQDCMDFSFAAGPFGGKAKGYERLLHDVMTGNPILFQSAEFVEQGWKLVQPILDAWQESPTEPFPNYASGSAGPKAADDLLATAGHSWSTLEQKEKSEHA